MKIAIKGPVHDITGYATITREIALALSRLGAEIGLHPVAWGTTKAELSEETKKQIDGFLARPWPFDVLLNIGIATGFTRTGEQPAVGLTMLEVDGLPAPWANLCNLMDEVWVPTHFNEETFSRSGVAAGKIKVTPLGIDTALFVPDGYRFSFPGVDREAFIFLSVFEWIPRKGYDLLLAAYLQEFTSADKVCLVLKSHSNSDYGPDRPAIERDIQEAIKQHCQSGDTAPGIALFSQVLPASQMPDLYRAADCFVLPTRGEGWNLPALEALACGVPVITTAWSAHLDWLNQENAFLIAVDGLESVPRFDIPNDLVYAGHRWARPSLEHLRSLMRWVFEHKYEAQAKARTARAMIESRLSWDASARLMYQRLQNLAPPRHDPVIPPRHTWINPKKPGRL